MFPPHNPPTLFISALVVTVLISASMPLKSLSCKLTHRRFILVKSGCFLIPSSDAKRGLCFHFCEGATSDATRRMKNGL